MDSKKLPLPGSTPGNGRSSLISGGGYQKGPVKGE